MNLEKRQHPRAEVKWPIVVETAERFIFGEAVDISANGAFVRCWKPLKLGQVFKMVFVDFPQPDSTLMICGGVVRASSLNPNNELNAYGMGVKFVQISPVDRTVISTIVSDRLKSRGIDWHEEEPEK